MLSIGRSIQIIITHEIITEITKVSKKINIPLNARRFLITKLGRNAIAFTKKNILFLLINNSNPEEHYYLHLSPNVRSHILKTLIQKYPNIDRRVFTYQKLVCE